MTPKKAFFKKEFRFSWTNLGEALFKRFSATEKVLFTILFVVLVFSAGRMAFEVNNAFLVEVPASGGTLVEGIVGTPRFINPVIAVTDADRDLAALTYSGLLKVGSDGRLVPDLASSYEVSDDGLTYAFKIRDDAYFHDGAPVTSDDVEFTVQKTQDAALKSPKRASWADVTIEKPSSKEIRFILKGPYAPFIENATLGILPKHLWKDVADEEFNFSLYNTEPIGSGPYKLSKINRDKAGLPESYELSAFSKYVLGKPHIDEIITRFYTNERSLVAAFKSGVIGSVNSISPSEAEGIKESGARVEQYPLPRVFGLFLNQSHMPMLSFQEVRTALDLSLDKERIIDEVLGGYGTPISGPIPPGLIGEHDLPKMTPEEHADNLTKAAELLADNGWKPNADGILEKKTSKGTNVLAFTISTSNAPELKRTAEIMKEEWAKIGADVTLTFYETADLNQNVIRPRKYDALLFGEIVGRDLDLFAFWHSSQRNDPGLNISLYVNSKTDKLLEDARTMSDRDGRFAKYQSFSDIVSKELPAIFVYAPDFIYALPAEVKGFVPRNITVPADRFATVSDWYIDTDKVWKVFADR